MTALRIDQGSTGLHKARYAPADAISLLSTHHRTVRQLFAEYDGGLPALSKKALVAEICSTLAVHEQVKEEIFYPELKSVLRDSFADCVDTSDGGAVKELIEQLQGVEPHGEPYDAQVRVLSLVVQHEAQSERSQTFPRAEASSVDMLDLGARMAARMDDLLARAA